MYNGKFILRFDDTNPSKEKDEYVNSIIDDLALLGMKHDQLTYSSDYFEQLYDIAKILISKGKAYCDNTAT
jgi:glutamyl-tRNA synthetase